MPRAMPGPADHPSPASANRPLPRRQALALLAAAAWAGPIHAASGPGASSPTGLAAAASPGGATPASTRYDPDGPARVRPLAGRSSLLDITRAGSRLVAVGERGHVLLSDDQGKT